MKAQTSQPVLNTAEFCIDTSRLQDILTFLRKSHRYYMDVMVPNLAASLERLAKLEKELAEISPTFPMRKMWLFRI